MHFVGALTAAVITLGLGACATVHNLPLNKPSANPFAGTLTQTAAIRAHATDGDGAVIGLAFSGGGTRAAAFSLGCWNE